MFRFENGSKIGGGLNKSVKLKSCMARPRLGGGGEGRRGGGLKKMMLTVWSMWLDWALNAKCSLLYSRLQGYKVTIYDSWIFLLSQVIAPCFGGGEEMLPVWSLWPDWGMDAECSLLYSRWLQGYKITRYDSISGSEHQWEQWWYQFIPSLMYGRFTAIHVDGLLQFPMF